MGGCRIPQHLQDEESELDLSALRCAPGRCDRQFSSAATKPVTVLGSLSPGRGRVPGLERRLELL